MYRHPTPLSPARHGGKRLLEARNHGFAVQEQLVRVSDAELASAATTVPLVFARSPEPGRFRLLGLLGLAPGRNLLVAPDGSWLRRWLPAAMRLYPLALLQQRGGDWTLCIDEGSGLLSDTAGEPLFVEGSASPWLSRRAEELRRFEQGVERLTRGACALAELGLLEPWSWLPNPPPNPMSADGLLYSLSEARLNALDSASFRRLRREGVLMLAYAQLLSMANLHVLEGLESLHQAQHSHLPGLSGGDSFHFT